MSTNELLLNNLIIPATLPYGNTRGASTIAFCREKLRVKYESTHESFDFDSYIAARAVADPSWVNRIEKQDAEKTRLMHSHYSDEQIEELMGRAERIGNTLREVPNDLALEEHIPEEVFNSIARVLRSFIRPRGGVLLPKATKVLCMKRPRLIPMLDQLVLRFLFEEEKERNAATGILGIRQFREMMRHGQNLEILHALTEETNCWLAELAKECPPTLTSVRVLDHLLWFDQDGYGAFGWVRDGDVVRPR